MKKVVKYKKGDFVQIKDHVKVRYPYDHKGNKCKGVILNELDTDKYVVDWSNGKSDFYHENELEPWNEVKSEALLSNIL